MKLFHFYRSEDVSGVSGTGPVVEGVQFTNGWCALRWLSSKSSICFYQSLEEVKAIHSHGGRTEIIVHDFEPTRRKSTAAGSARMELLMQIIEETSRLVSGEDDPRLTTARIRESIADIKSLLDELERSFAKRRRRAA